MMTPKVPARIRIDDGRVKLFLPHSGEWTYVDWPWLMATMSTDRAWFVHGGSRNAES